ncbi:divergent PAP2 family protein [Thiomicrorhabdus lithotrophica]|uniref:Divergent PAP2 family protein n=1 Tax=Thiomicrorhabdus lithotrophica TaxID=2949997 RepID=A0ABY8C814_9GAMM|nr:divergent PAP2 family protein [Thiomicrorhabdus lithotrophica]WEJ62099.1 divergent PAP2 family protein [Thiomicrorhabdus lithotrophica]
MEYIYLITPFSAWLVAGITKFIVNSIKAKQLAFGLIGYGGLPSNHSAIVSSMVFLIALKEGVAHPAFGVAVTLAFIVLLDANSLRQQVGKHAKAINALQADTKNKPLRERMGHTRIEILAGVAVGFVVAWVLFNLFSNVAA